MFYVILERPASADCGTRQQFTSSRQVLGRHDWRRHNGAQYTYWYVLVVGVVVAHVVVVVVVVVVSASKPGVQPRLQSWGSNFLV